MIVELAPIIASFVAGLLGFFTGKFGLARRVLQLEMRQDDLEERHVSNVRKAAARARWDSDEQLDMKLETFVQSKPPAKAGWSKWGSSKSSN